MKAIITTALVALSFVAMSQTVKVSGTVLYMDCDTFSLTSISDRGQISTMNYTGLFWTAYLDAGTNYFLIHECGNKRKVLNVKTGRMDVESIEIDIDMSSRSEATIYLTKKSAKFYTLQIEGSGYIRVSTIERRQNIF